MKKLFAAAAVLALMAGTSAFAQGERGGRGEGGGGNRPQAQAAAPAQHYGGQPGGGYHPQAQTATPAQHYGGQQYGGARYAPPAGGGYRGGGAPAYQVQARPHGYAIRPGWGAPGGDGGHGAPHYDAHYYPRVVTLGAHYHWMGGDWRPQRGFYYHRWVYGEFLPFGWFDQSYWVSDYWDYGLPVPPYGYAWVRAGPDVLMINLETGFVAESVYGVFF